MSKMIFENKDGLLIIIPEGYQADTLDCPICGFALRHKEDLIENKRFGCCIDCSMHFMQPNRKKWKEGWRPTRKEVESVIIRDSIGD